MAALDAIGHPAMIIGGIAVIARGVARRTKDIDATIAGGDADLDRVVEALSSHRIIPRIPGAVEFLLWTAGASARRSRARRDDDHQQQNSVRRPGFD